MKRKRRVKPDTPQSRYYYRNQEQKKKEQLDYYHRTKERFFKKIREYRKKEYRSENPYHKTEKGKEAKKIANENYIKKYPWKYEARCRLRTAVKVGMVEKRPCLICKKEKSEAHHPNYNMSLWVIWLCRDCHKELHGNLAKLNNLE